MQGLAGLVALALVGLWVTYLVPHVRRHREVLLESRADDRYSAALRVVAVAATGRVVRPVEQRAVRPVPAGCTRSGHVTGLLTPGRGQHTVSRSRPEGGTTVDRPHATDQRRSAEAVREVARLRAAHAAAVARRGAAARRRGVLAAVLAVAMVVGWVGVVVAPALSVTAALVPAGLLVLVVGLGRGAVVSGRRHDEEWRELVDRAERGVGAARPVSGPVAAAPAPRAPAAAPRTASGPARPHADLETTAVPMAPADVVGRAVHPSQAMTDVFDVIVADGGESGAPARHASGATPVVAQVRAEPPTAHRPSAADDDSWSPVPVPLPTYALKPAAPHREPAPLGDLEPAPQVLAVAENAEPQTTGSIDLDAVLERRRASGL
ncbi:MAG: hypothetical protein L6367_11680 [Cellulomonas sp.]|nr:hypothetical protein [Cellulomonas sp.]